MTSLEGWVYCPRCRTELELAGGRASCPACGFVAYANPAATACAVCGDDRGRVLLARRAGPPFAGHWDLPGGFVDEGEHPLDTIRRELREETALEVEPHTFLGAWVDRYGEGGDGAATLNLYWTAQIVAGEPVAADDVSEVKWFDADDLPPRDEFAFHVAEVVETWIRGY